MEPIRMPDTPNIDVRKKVLGQVSYRSAQIGRAIDTESRSIEIAFSSETPVERSYGFEILDHSPMAVRLDRINSGGAVLINHDPDDHVGVVDSARIDADRKGRASIRFSRSKDGEEAMQDVADGIRQNVSVSYLVHDMVLESTNDDGRTYRVTDWEPLEITLASVPADVAVGVGRSFSTTDQESPMDDELDTMTGDVAVPDSAITDTDTGTEERAVAAPINPDAAQIRSIGAHFGLRDLAEDQIMLGATLQQFRDLVRTKRADPIATVPRVEARIPRHAGALRAFRPELYDGGRREAEEQAYRAGQWARATIFGDMSAARWCRDHDMRIAQRVLTGTAGGQSAIVPDELALPIISLREQYGLARRMCYVHPMVTDTASVPRDTGDASAYFVGRETAPTASDPSFDNVNLVAKNVAAETRISNDYADDSAINLADHVAQKHARAFAVKEDECLLNGDGTSTYGGIVGLRTAILGLAGAIEATATHDLASEIDATDLRSLMAALPDYPGINPSWITSKPFQELVFGRLMDAGSGNNKVNLASRMPVTYAGYDIATTPAMPKVQTSLDAVVMVLFGDLSMGVIFGDRRGMTMMVDPYSLSSYQQTKIISSERFDINCHGVGSSTEAGPVVALIGNVA
jgi:HK97 family phage major capsid protein